MLERRWTESRSPCMKASASTLCFGAAPYEAPWSTKLSWCPGVFILQLIMDSFPAGAALSLAVLTCMWDLSFLVVSSEPHHSSKHSSGTRCCPCPEEAFQCSCWRNVDGSKWDTRNSVVTWGGKFFSPSSYRLEWHTSSQIFLTFLTALSGRFEAGSPLRYKLSWMGPWWQP